jgi:hypothetical protein
MIALRRPGWRFSPRELLGRMNFEPLEALPLLTIVLLLTAMPDQWYLRGPLVAMFAVGVVYRRWLAQPQFWYITATLLGTTVYLNWESSDNHKYLFVYWCLALCTAFSLPRDQQATALATSSRWLIGLCMLLAAIWKLAMPDYRTGSFFEFTLLADERFAHFTHVVGGLSLKSLAENRTLQELLREGHLHGAGIRSVVFGGSPAIGSVAQAMTWWTVAIEGLLALAFLAPACLAPKWRGAATLRNTLLLLFAVTTYSIAPVRGFGWMLMLLGLAQCGDRERTWRPLYLAAIVLIQAYTLPVAAVVERLLQP